MNQIKYRDGYKYQLAEEYSAKTDVIGHTIDTQFIKLSPIGVLIVRSGYAWDGASGPAIDTKNAMRGSLEHDAFYQLLRMELLPQSERDAVDDRLESVCIEDGMSDFRASAWNVGLEVFGAAAADPKNRKKVHTAP